MGNLKNLIDEPMDARALTTKLTADRLDAHVARRLRKRRMKKGLTLAAVAQGASTSYQQIQKYESGRDRISAGRLYLLSLTLAVPIRYFFQGLPKCRARSGRVYLWKPRPR